MTIQDGHSSDPIQDVKAKIEYSNPSRVSVIDVPPKPPVFTRGGEPLAPSFLNQGVSAVNQAVEAALQRVKINGESPTFNGNSINFDIPVKKTESVPVVSDVVHPVPAPQGRSSLDTSIYEAATPKTRSGSSEYGGEMIFPNGNPSTPKPTSKPKDDDGGDDDRESKNPRASSSNSKDRQKGESNLEWAERKKELKEFQANPSIAQAIAHGDTSFFTSGYIPVLFTRADGARKILSYVIEDNSQVIEGAAAFEKVGPLPAEDSYYLAGGAGGQDHPWKVTDGGIVDDVQKWNVVGGEVYSGGQGVMIAVPNTLVTGAAGDIILKITRGASSREITAAEIVSEVQPGTPASDDLFQFRVLATVGGAPLILQKQFEEFRTYEMLVVENGEFALAPFELSTMNTYAPPV